MHPRGADHDAHSQSSDPSPDGMGHRDVGVVPGGRHHNDTDISFLASRNPRSRDGKVEGGKIRDAALECNNRVYNVVFRWRRRTSGPTNDPNGHMTRPTCFVFKNQSPLPNPIVLKCTATKIFPFSVFR